MVRIVRSVLQAIEHAALSTFDGIWMGGNSS
jgi:hypothetical protein